RKFKSSQAHQLSLPSELRLGKSQTCCIMLYACCMRTRRQRRTDKGVPILFGAIAQLGERLLCKQEVVGSIPSGSTSRVQLVRNFEFPRPSLCRKCLSQVA